MTNITGSIKSKTEKNYAKLVRRLTYLYAAESLYRLIRMDIGECSGRMVIEPEEWYWSAEEDNTLFTSLQYLLSKEPVEYNALREFHQQRKERLLHAPELSRTICLSVQETKSLISKINAV